VVARGVLGGCSLVSMVIYIGGCNGYQGGLDGVLVGFYGDLGGCYGDLGAFLW